MKPTERKAWQQLAQIAAERIDSHLKNSLADPARSLQLGHSLAGILFDFGKQRVDTGVMTALMRLAQECGLVALREALFAGQPINVTEHRAALHPALRGGAAAVDPSIAADVAHTATRMADIARRLRDGTWRGYSGKPMTDIVHIGIGGSHLGPELVVTALAQDATTHLRLHFVANIDSNDLLAKLKPLDPRTTLFIVASKSFSTLETRVNAQSARSWFVERTNAPIADHFIGITSNLAAASAFGFDAANLLPMWDWVGGRFSLWSAVGLPILIALGEDHFQSLLAGARAVDLHFQTAPIDANVPVIAALVATWNCNFLGAASHAILAYDERLHLLAEYLQQLEMESNGKSVTREGDAVDYHTMPILWGGTGSKGQHAYHQLLHQGTRAYSADFVLVGRDPNALAEHHDWLLASALGQSQAMALGFEPDDAGDRHKRVAGNHPTTTIVLDELGPRQLGALLATYEHKVFCQGAIWNINSFDQWGVELGKELARPIHEQLSAPEPPTVDGDATTSHLIAHLRERAKFARRR